MSEQPYPIAEIFTSPQGEGAYAGTLMLFVRLAGCNVGRYIPAAELPPQLASLRILSPKHSICTSALGNQQFLCDTDYFKTASMTPAQILSGVSTTKHMCITGGEPLMHNLMPLARAALIKKIDVHIETSGTLPIPQALAEMCWITCSPKAGFLPENRSKIREYKFVINPDRIDRVEAVAQIRELTGGLHREQLFYIQAVNGVNELCHESHQGLLDMQRLEPRLRISVQLHKILGVR